MKCPNCDGEMVEDVEEGVWTCTDCGYVEDRALSHPPVRMES